MAKVERVICDQCKALKLDTNHWFMAYTNSLGMLTVMRWSEEKADVSRHLCGQACVVAELNAWMNTERD
jgi:hypothetical protein